MAMQVASLFASIGAETSGLEKGLSNAESSIQKTAKSINKFGDGFDNSLKGMGQGAVAFGQDWLKTMGAIGTAAAPAIATVVALKKVLDFSHEGAQLQRLEDTSYSLAKSMGMDMNNIMNSVRSASLGMVSDSDIMQSSARAMMLGVGNSAEQIAQLMEVAAMRGRAMGISTTQAFNDIITGIGRMSPLILDNLGIVTGGQKTFDDYARSIGKVTDALTDAERKQALINKAIEGTAPLLEAEGGLARDVAGNWEYAASQVQTYIDNLKKAIALERGGAGGGGFDYANGMPVGKTGGLGYVEGIGLGFERANIDKQNKDLIALAVSIGLVSEAEQTWANMPIIGTRDERASWVASLMPALNEYNRLVTETGMSSTKAAEQVKFLYETYGTGAFISNADEWAAANDRVWMSMDSTTQSTNQMSEAALAYQIRLRQWRIELAETAQVLREDLADAYTTVAQAEQEWRLGVSGDLKGRLDEEWESGKIGIDKYKSSLDILDKTYGTNYVMQFEMKMELDDLFKTLLENPEEFAEKAKAFEDVFMPLDSSVQNAMAAVGNLQKQLSALERTYNAKINIVIATYGAGVGGNLGDLGGDLGGLGGSEGGDSVTPGLKAMGGYELAGQPYIVGEAGPELFIPDTNGRVYSNASTGAMLGGDNGDLLAALGRLPTASDIAMAVRDALLMVGA